MAGGAINGVIGALALGFSASLFARFCQVVSRANQTDHAAFLPVPCGTMCARTRHSKLSNVYCGGADGVFFTFFIDTFFMEAQERVRTTRC